MLHPLIKVTDIAGIILYQCRPMVNTMNDVLMFVSSGLQDYCRGNSVIYEV